MREYPNQKTLDGLGGKKLGVFNAMPKVWFR